MRSPQRLCSARMTAELRHLRAFLAIADEGSVTGAADRLRVSQPALSRTLRQLETHLGVLLVDRSTHHLRLTAEGRTFRDKAALALAAVDDALDPGRLRQWPLRLGHAWSALGRYTTPLLRRWKETHPDTPLELLRVDDRTAGLLSGRVDAALVRAPALPPTAESAERLGEHLGEGLRAERLLDERRVAAVPSGSELADAPGPLTLADLSRRPVALNTVSGLTTLDLWPADLRPDPARTVRVANTDDWLGEIAAGNAVGVSTDATAEMHPHPGVAYRALTGTDDVPVLLVWRAAPGHPAVRRLVALAREVLSDGPSGPAAEPTGTD
jgi:DNA-binding transcriptional LysR family regulator